MPPPLITCKQKLLHALEKEPGSREIEDLKTLEKYVRSMSFFKLYKEFEPSDFHSLCQDMKFHKIHRNTRLTNYGENADQVYVILKGRIAMTHPNKEYF